MGAWYMKHSLHIKFSHSFKRDPLCLGLECHPITAVSWNSLCHISMRQNQSQILLLIWHWTGLSLMPQRTERLRNLLHSKWEECWDTKTFLLVQILYVIAEHDCWRKPENDNIQWKLRIWFSITISKTERQGDGNRQQTNLAPSGSGSKGL